MSEYDSQWEREERRREKLLKAFRDRENSAFGAMVAIGFLLGSTEYFVYFFFIFFAIFGAFQLNYMALIKDMSVRSPADVGSVVGGNSSRIETSGLRGGFLANLTNGVLGNFVWWIIFMLGVFAFQQYNPMTKSISPPIGASDPIISENIAPHTANE